MTDTLSNANTPGLAAGQARTVVFFSAIPWQTTNPRAPYFAYGWMNDVLVGNPFSFQLRVDGNFLNGGLILRDVGTGQEVPAIAARVNHSRNCGLNLECFPSPGQQEYVQRPILPANTPIFSVELVAGCRGRLQYTDLRCPSQPNGDPNGAQATPDVVTVLTISPPVRPSAPQHGQKFEYELVARNPNGEVATRITAIYSAPGQCRIDNLLSNPNSGTAGDRISVEWFVRECYQAVVTTDDPAVKTLYFRKVASSNNASEPDFNDSRPYVLPKRLAVGFAIDAFDAMGRRVARSTSATVDACSISLTHPQCPTRCQAMPPPSGCPVPPQPQCSVGEGDANRQYKQFSFEVLCSTGGGTAFKKPESEWACTEAEAKLGVNNRQTLGCAVVAATGEWVSPDGSMTSGPECPGGATKTDWEFCLACSSQTGPVLTSEKRGACFLPDAVDAASASRPTQSCWMQNQGECQKP